VRKQIRAFMLHKAWARVLSDIVKRRSFRANVSGRVLIDLCREAFCALSKVLRRRNLHASADF
jgi:hypothetical protein